VGASLQVSPARLRRLEEHGVADDTWVVVEPRDVADLQNYRRFRRRSGSGLVPSRMFYNQPNEGEQVHKDDIDQLYYLP